jgi:hypothetical protein
VNPQNGVSGSSGTSDSKKGKPKAEPPDLYNHRMDGIEGCSAGDTPVLRIKKKARSRTNSDDEVSDIDTTTDLRFFVNLVYSFVFID